VRRIGIPFPQQRALTTKAKSVGRRLRHGWLGPFDTAAKKLKEWDLK
jgi:hypothetical protein